MAVVNRNVWKRPVQSVGALVEVQDVEGDSVPVVEHEPVSEPVVERSSEVVDTPVEDTPEHTPVAVPVEDEYTTRVHALDERLAAGRKRFSSKMSDVTYEALRRAAFERDMQKQAMVEEILHWALVEGNFDMRVFDVYAQVHNS